MLISILQIASVHYNVRYKRIVKYSPKTKRTSKHKDKRLAEMS